MSTEEDVARHYTRGNLERSILDALVADGKDIERLKPEDLSAADEFHLGWRAATIELGKSLTVQPDQTLLDIGSGIGGPARYFADAHRAVVTGIDLTEEFVTVANDLTRRCGLAGRASFELGSALAMPFGDARFDVATLIHVGMNIADKAKLFAETRRVLRRDGRFGVYEVMRASDADLPYPMPWAETPETSFVETPETYRRLLEGAGFTIDAETDRRDFVLKLAAEMRARAEASEPRQLSINATTTPDRLKNVMAALQAGTIAPVEIIARAA